jgi:hypothetical protein
MCDLLGNGDPQVAHVELGHKLIELIEHGDDTTAIEAACYSLGFITAADTHLARLEEFAATRYIDQRQARRYSDRGLEQLARLIATHWTVPTVPEATIIVVPGEPDGLGLMVRLNHQWHVTMQEPRLSVWLDDEPGPTTVQAQWRTEEHTQDDPWQTIALVEPLPVKLGRTETTIRLEWRGEVWPKFTVAVAGALDVFMVRVETLGAVCAVGVDSHRR